MRSLSRDVLFGLGSFLLGALIGLTLSWSLTQMLPSDQIRREQHSKMEFLQHTLSDGVRIAVQYDFVEAAIPGYGRPVIEIENGKFRFRFNPPFLDLAYCDDPSEFKVFIKSSDATTVEFEMFRNNGTPHQFRVNARGLIVAN